MTTATFNTRTWQMGPRPYRLDVTSPAAGVCASIALSLAGRAPVGRLGKETRAP